MKYLTMTGFTVQTASDRWTLGYEGENNSRTLQIKTTDDLTDFATVNLLIDTLDCGAMTVTTVGNFKVLSMVLTAGMLGEAGKKTCQLLMMDSEGTVIKKSNQFYMVVGHSNVIEGTVPDSERIVIITDYIEEKVGELLGDIDDTVDLHTEEIEELKPVKNDLYSEIPVTTQNGYYTKDGKIAVASIDMMEVSTNYFNVTPNEEILFVINNDTGKNAWAAVALCAIDGSWINRDVIATGTNVSGEYRYVIPAGVYLLAYSYRTYDGDVTMLAKRNVVEVLKKEVGFAEYQFDYGDGYFGKSGEITAQTSSKEKYTEDYIPVIGDETLTVTIKLKTSKDQWARWIFYNSDKEFISYGNTVNSASDSMSIPINVPVNASYMRISFRTYDIFNGLVINRNEGAFEAIKKYGNAINNSIIKHNKNCIFVSHRGYDPASTGTEGGNNKLECYYAASQHGFDASETDVRFTSDLIPVCCHDASFVDATSGETVTIATSTLSELQTHDYYGSKIASFEDVLKACKNTGMMLFIDKLNTATTSEMETVINIVKQYGMQDKVCWIFAPSADTNVQAVLNSMPNTGIEVLSTDANVSANTLVTYGNGIASNLNTVYVAVNFTRTTPEEIKQLALTLDSRAKMAVWTLTAYIPRYLEYMPYVVAITTSGVSYNDICKRYGF